MLPSGNIAPGGLSSKTLDKPIHKVLALYSPSIRPQPYTTEGLQRLNMWDGLADSAGFLYTRVITTKEKPMISRVTFTIEHGEDTDAFQVFVEDAADNAVYIPGIEEVSYEVEVDVK